MFGLDYELNLSTRPDNYLGESAMWDRAEAALTEALNSTGRPWKLNPGDGAFYGPKIDITVFDALRRKFQCATVQLDFQLPIRCVALVSAAASSALYAWQATSVCTPSRRPLGTYPATLQ